MNNTKGITILEKDYLNDLNKIKETIRNNQNKAMVVVNSAMIMTYYEIGTIINKRKVWGNKYIENLANDLGEYGNSYSFRNLKYMSQFSKEFSESEIRQQPVAQIPWGTLITVIMPKSKSHQEMLWYIKETHKNGWSRSMVLNQIAMKAYERSLINPTTTEAANNSKELTNELFKDTYVFGFLDKEKIKTEKDLKNQMIDNIINFLQELGPGFTLAGKEYKLITPTGKDFYIDLLMYHTKIHAYVVIEVKIGEFDPRDIGQLEFYVNAIDDLEKVDGDNDTIGLLLCKDADKYVAETTLKKNHLSLGISKYKLIEELPEYLERKLKEIKG
ncbi:MAG: PDDEXK nuclease domain-containing protein [Anaeroplasma sp.]|nr:PDDEXK nuclease domain-containing protein [Anaeroplasma sp.]